LPVHYHPNRAFAKKHLALDHGKTEAWIILEAPEQAHVGLGFAREMKKSEVASMVEARDAQGLMDSLQKFEVKPGDAILVPAGTPHSIGEGIFVLELQEPTDLSALLEWNDFAVDGAKDGHLGLGFDLVLDALRYTPVDKDESSLLLTRNRLSAPGSIFTAAADPYFRADYISALTGSIESGFGIFLGLSGGGEVCFESAEKIHIVKGDALLVPTAAGSWSVNGVEGLLARPPLPSFAGQGQ
jgi:mannose-6-phosphate isomerase